MPSTFNKYVARYMMLGDGFRKLIIGITGPSSYTTTGEAITPQQFSLGYIEWFPDVFLVNSLGAIVLARYNDTTAKLQYFNPGGAGGGEISYTPADNKGATITTAGSVTADQAAVPVNSAIYKAATADSTLLGTITPTTQPELPRNIQVTVNNPTGGALDLFTGGGTVNFTITGTFRGAAQVEVLPFTVSGGQAAIAAGKCRFQQSTKPFDTVTGVTYNGTATMGDALTIALGPGSKLGLPAPRFTPADADVFVFAVTGVPQTIAGAFSDANQTVETGTTADAWDLVLVYKSAGASSGSEVANATDLSGYTGRTLVHGR
jgi:hypothetical protein